MYIVLAILAFGFLVAIHEFGHFISARACGVRVKEFSVGMGPLLLKKQGKETQYSLRLLPIGGYCAMEGEDEESDDPRALMNKKPWQKIIILASGSVMNFLTGLVIVIIMFSQVTAIVTPVVAELAEGFECSGENGIMVGDRITEINGHRIFYVSDFSTYMSRSNGKTVDIELVRDGEKILLDDLPLTLKEFEIDGEKVQKYGISFTPVEATAGEKLKYSFYSVYNFVRLVKMGLTDLVSGAVGVRDLYGAVGMVSEINNVAASASSTHDALMNIAYLCAFIAVNLAVMNLLPIPAMDGGRIFALIVTCIIELISGKKVDPKYEAYIHTVGMLLLLGLMIFTIFNDITRIIYG